ncbi:MAG: Coenzyme F420 hydrogenase/dehydrogenase, beta subunit C-terminal domain [Sphingomonadaceae bacterium]
MSVKTTPALPPTLRRVLRGNMCSGCGLCAGLDPAIALKRDDKGWWRPSPVGTPRPETDALLAETCPGARISPWEGGEPREISPIWGPYLRIATGHATDPEIRHTGSSGGALSALAVHLLATGEVDRVLHVAMDPDAPLLTHIVRSSGRGDVLRAAGSRYAPAAPLAEIRAELSEPGRILFIGKPCDAGAMRQLLRAEPELVDRIPYILSFFCGGTPSQRGTERLVRRMGLEPDDITSFRYRGDGWPGQSSAVDARGRTGALSYATSWGEELSKEVQFRCGLCSDSVGGAADIAAADAWYGDETGYPTFDEADGRSLLIARTARGEALLRAAESARAIETAPLPIGEIVKMQPYQAKRKHLNAARLAATYVMNSPRPDTRGLKLLDAARDAGLPALLKSFAGTARRIFRNRRAGR